MQDDRLSGFFRTQLRGIDHDLGLGWRFVRIGNSGEFFYDPGPRFRIKAFAIALLTYIKRCSDVYENESPEGFDHLSHGLASCLVGSDRRTDRNASIFRDFGGDVSNTTNV